FTQDRGLRAASAEPAPKLTLGGDDRRVSRLRGARRLAAHDGRENEGLLPTQQICGEDQDVVAHGISFPSFAETRWEASGLSTSVSAAAGQETASISFSWRRKTCFPQPSPFAAPSSGKRVRS